MKPSTAATLAMLRRHPEGSTSLDAVYDIGVGRLAARVQELRAEGYVIETVWITTPSHKRVAKYRLVEGDAQLRLAIA